MQVTHSVERLLSKMDPVDRLIKETQAGLGMFLGPLLGGPLLTILDFSIEGVGLAVGFFLLMGLGFMVGAFIPKKGMKN